MEGKRLFQLDGSVNCATFGMALIIVLYIVGYTIHTIYCETFGINENNLLKSEYLKVGAAYCFVDLYIAAPLACIIFSIYRRIKKVRIEVNRDFYSKSNITVFKKIRRGNELFFHRKNFRFTVLCGTNFFIVTLHFLLFSIKEDLTLRIHWLLNLKMSWIFIGYISIAIATMVILGGIRRMINDGIVKNVPRMWMIHFCIGLMLFLISCFVDGVILSKFYPSIHTILIKILYIDAISFVMIMLVAYGVWRFKSLSAARDKSAFVFLISTASIVLFFISLYLYTFLFYPMIPRNRGGRYPLVRCQNIVLSPKAFPLLGEALIRLADGGTLFLAGENDENYYFERTYAMDEIGMNNTPKVIQVRKDLVIGMEMVRDVDRLKRMWNARGERIRAPGL